MALNANGIATNAFGVLVGATTTMNASTTNSYGIGVNASSGALHNYAAEFLGGNVGIGTSSPGSLLTVWGVDTASTSAFSVVNSASTTVFNVFDNGNSTYSGSIFQSSDQRLKDDVQTIDASSALAEIQALNPVSYNRIDQPNTALNFGFIAQAVQQIFPNLVSTTSPTALTPDGTLTLNYSGLIAPVVAAIQEVTNISGSFQSNLIAWLGNASNKISDLFAQNGHFSNELCVGTTCVTPAQFQAMVAAAQASANTPAQQLNNTNATSTPPVIVVNGDNPATITVGATYNDLGATITGPTADLNLGISASVDGGATTTLAQIVIDTTQSGTHTIVYSATDQNGLTELVARTVNVVAGGGSSLVTTASSTAATSTTP